jgi:hypothetical protein
MPQATRRWITDKVRSLSQAELLPLQEILDAYMVDSVLQAGGVTFHERIFTPFVTLCMSLSQRPGELGGGNRCREIGVNSIFRGEKSSDTDYPFGND